MTIKDIRPLLKAVLRSDVCVTDVCTGESIDIDNAIYDDYVICSYVYNDEEDIAPMDVRHTFTVKKPAQYLVAYEAETNSWRENWTAHMNEDELKDFIEQLSPDTLKAVTITPIHK